MGTSTMVDPQVSRMHTAKKMLRGCGGTEGKTNELTTVTWRKKTYRNVFNNLFVFPSKKMSFGHHVQMNCILSTFPQQVWEKKSQTLVTF